LFFEAAEHVFLKFTNMKVHVQSILYLGYTLSVEYSPFNVGYYSVLVKKDREIIWCTKNRVRKLDAIAEAKVWVGDKVSNDKAGCDLTGF
jgi:hypothetical protein